MSPFLSIGLIAVSVGYLVAYVTALLMGKEKASRTPGGSLALGFVIASIISNFQPGLSIYGAVLGILGWLIWFWLFGRH